MRYIILNTETGQKLKEPGWSKGNNAMVAIDSFWIDSLDDATVYNTFEEAESIVKKLDRIFGKRCAAVFEMEDYLKKVNATAN